jgi:hypothetical protein
LRQAVFRRPRVNAIFERERGLRAARAPENQKKKKTARHSGNKIGSDFSSPILLHFAPKRKSASSLNFRFGDFIRRFP